MGSKQVVKIGPLEYEAEVLTGLTAANAVKETEIELWDFVSSKWQFSEETETYKINDRKARRERAIFNGLFPQVRAIMAADKNGAFEEPGELFDMARTNAGEFERLYEAAIKANPTLKKPELEDTETDSKN